MWNSDMPLVCVQDPKDKRKIKPDEKLKKVFPTTVTMFSMNKVLSKHFLGAGERSVQGAGRSAWQPASAGSQQASSSWCTGKFLAGPGQVLGMEYLAHHGVCSPGWGMDASPFTSHHLCLLAV